MSGLVSGITKVFSSMGTGAATLGSAVRGAGASLFTAGAATGTGLAGAAQGGGALSGLLGGGSVLGNVLGGAIKQGLSSGLIGGAVGALTGKGFGEGFKQGGLIGAIGGSLGGLFSPTTAAAASPTGLDPMTTGSTAASSGAGAGAGFGAGSMPAARAADLASVPGYAASGGGGGAASPSTVPVVGTGATAATEASGGWKGLGNFLNSNAGASMIGGIGTALGEERQYELISQMKEDDRKFLRDKEQRLQDSYVGSDQAVAGATPSAPDQTRRPTPAARWAYNPQTGMIDMTA